MAESKREGESRKRKIKKIKEVLSLSLPNPALSPFFLAHFSLRFPNYIKGLLTGLVTTCIPFISSFLWYIFDLSVEHFWRFVIDQRERIWQLTNFSTAFKLRNCHFLFLFCFLSLFFSLSVSIVVLDVFFVSLPSLTHFPPFTTTSSPSPPPPSLVAPDKRERPLVLLQTFPSTIQRSWLTQKVRPVLWSERLCTHWRFSVMETLTVILNRWQVKWLKVPFNSVWKENIVFSPKNNNK